MREREKILCAQREVIQGYYLKVFSEKPTVETILQWLEDDLRHLAKEDVKFKEPKNTDLHNPESLRNFLIELKNAIEEGEDVDYGYNGEDEFAIVTFKTDESLKEVIKLLQKYNLIPNGSIIDFEKGFSEGWKNRPC